MEVVVAKLLCVNNVPVPIVQMKVMDLDGEDRLTNFVDFTSRQADLRWLENALGA